VQHFPHVPKITSEAPITIMCVFCPKIHTDSRPIVKNELMTPKAWKMYYKIILHLHHSPKEMQLESTWPLPFPISPYLHNGRAVFDSTRGRFSPSIFDEFEWNFRYGSSEHIWVKLWSPILKFVFIFFGIWESLWKFIGILSKLRPILSHYLELVDRKKI